MRVGPGVRPCRVRAHRVGCVDPTVGDRCQDCLVGCRQGHRHVGARVGSRRLAGPYVTCGAGRLRLIDQCPAARRRRICDRIRRGGQDQQVTGRCL